jgi:hypothetical protein
MSKKIHITNLSKNELFIEFEDMPSEVCKKIVESIKERGFFVTWGVGGQNV